MITKEQFDNLEVGSRIRSSGRRFPSITNRLGTVIKKTEDGIRVRWDAVEGEWAYTNTSEGYACLNSPCESFSLDINEII